MASIANDSVPLLAIDFGTSAAMLLLFDGDVLLGLGVVPPAPPLLLLLHPARDRAATAVTAAMRTSGRRRTGDTKSSS